jgi:protoheme IX farnesyltransferase
MAHVQHLDPTADRDPLDDISTAEVGDYLALLKPRVMSLVVFTAMAGLLLAPGGVNPVIAIISIVAITIGAGASGALNMWYDADIDRKMARTATRPVPSGRVKPSEALAFGLVLSIGSVAILGLAANWLAAGLLAFTIFFYAVIYTMWLKRWTSQNIVIGGAAGALPPVIGWAVVTNSVGIESAVLFLIIFLWTPPHFWALGLLKAEDYRRAGVPMLPVTAGPSATARQIMLYSLLLVPAGVAPAFVGMASVSYGILAAGLGAFFVWRAVPILRSGGEDRRASGQMFGYSLLYLFVIFAALLLDRALDQLGWLG